MPVVHTEAMCPAVLDSDQTLKGFATCWEFSFYRQKKVADFEYQSLLAIDK